MLNLIIGGGDSYINSTSKKRGKSHGVRKPRKIDSKSGNKISQIAAKFGQDSKGINVARPRSKSVGMSNWAKAGLGVSIPLGSAAVAIGLRFGIKHLIRKYGNCDLLRHCYGIYSLGSGDCSKICFKYECKNKENFKEFGYEFFFVSSKKDKNDQPEEIYLVYREFSQKFKKSINYDYDPPNLIGCVIDVNMWWNFKKEIGVSGYYLCLENNFTANAATDALANAADFLTSKFFDAATKKADDRNVNKMYSEKAGFLKRFIKDKILEYTGDCYGELKIAYVTEEQINQLRTSGFNVKCVLGNLQN